MIRRPPRSTLDRSSAASDVYKRQVLDAVEAQGISYIEVVELLEREGVEKFEKAWVSLLADVTGALARA